MTTKNLLFHPEHKEYFMLDGKVYCTKEIRNNRYADKILEWRSLGYYEVSASKKDNGYLRIKVGNKDYYLHRFVFECHNNRKIEDCMVINHIDENKENNSIENLEEISQKENINHGTRTERAHKKTRKKIVQIDLCGNIIREWSSMSEAAKSGFNQGAISNCCNEKTKTSGGYIWRFV